MLLGSIFSAMQIFAPSFMDFGSTIAEMEEHFHPQSRSVAKYSAADLVSASFTGYKSCLVKHI